MRLYVMRHGPAEDRAPTGRDPDRALTRAGRDVVERAARALHEARAAAPLRIISSPYLRAAETAEIMARVFGAGAPDLHDDLAGDADLPLDLVRAAQAAGDDVLLVGHQPIVEELVRVLVHPARPSFGQGFRTATIAALEHAEDRFRLATIIDPHAGH
ncbi:Phosphohistidine phosphatase SixA [Minicystis rosea]|nr:Phosphohistidine phosphatase SixA [Minicystis rosea]